jgi:DNA-binding IclR family transcriptional regulator
MRGPQRIIAEVLAALRRAPDSIVGIARKVGIGIETVQEVLDELEVEGMVYRTDEGLYGVEAEHARRS